MLAFLFCNFLFFNCYSNSPKYCVADELTINISSECAETGSNVCFDVTVEDFNSLVGWQYSITWDATILEFSNVVIPQFNQMNLKDEDFARVDGEVNVLRTAWISDMVIPLNLDNGTLIYQICYDVVGEGGGQTNITIGNDPLVIEIIISEQPGDTELIGLITNGGAFTAKADPNSITINEQVTDLVFSCDAQVPTVIDLTATTGCAVSQEVEITFQEQQFPLCGNSFYLIRTWVLTDRCGNEETVSRRMDFLDQLAPQMNNNPEDVTLTLSSDEDLMEPNLNDLNVTDNCNDFVLSYTDSIEYQIENQYRVRRGYFAEDDCGNFNYKQHLITVNIGDVWPGDTDNSFSVDQLDLFNIGFGFGETGPARSNANLNWSGQYASVWDNNAPDGTNYRHVDTNGDGIVNDDDTEAVTLNWAMTHNFQTDDSRSGMELPLSLELNEIKEDGTLILDVNFGDSNLPLDNFYGLAFTLNFDQSKIDPTSLKIIYEDNWIGTYLENYMQIQKVVNGKLETAIVKKDHVGSNGFGKIASFECKLKEAFVSQATELVFSISQAGGVYADGTAFQTALSEEVIEFEPTSSIDPILNQIELYPNPTKGMIYIQEAGELQIESISIYNNLGVLMSTSKLSNQVILENYPTGVYMLLLNTTRGEVWKRVVKE